MNEQLKTIIEQYDPNLALDFIDVYVKRAGSEHHWPTFNVADIAICVGVGLMAFATVLSAPAAPEPDARGLNWWALLAGGTALALIGVPLELVLEAPGGLLTAIGGGLAIVGVVFGYP